MDTSIMLKALSVYMVASGLVLMVRGKTLPLMLKDFFAHPAMLWLAGLVLILIGSPLAFSAGETLLVTALGWLILAKGVMYILFPELASRFVVKMSRMLLAVLGVVVIAFGVFVYTLA